MEEMIVNVVDAVEPAARALALVSSLKFIMLGWSEGTDGRVW